MIDFVDSEFLRWRVLFLEKIICDFFSFFS